MFLLQDKLQHEEEKRRLSRLLHYPNDKDLFYTPTIKGIGKIKLGKLIQNYRKIEAKINFRLFKFLEYARQFVENLEYYKTHALRRASGLKFNQNDMSTNTIPNLNEVYTSSITVDFLPTPDDLKRVYNITNQNNKNNVNDDLIVTLKAWIAEYKQMLGELKNIINGQFKTNIKKINEIGIVSNPYSMYKIIPNIRNRDFSNRKSGNLMNQLFTSLDTLYPDDIILDISDNSANKPIKDIVSITSQQNNVLQKIIGLFNNNFKNHAKVDMGYLCLEEETTLAPKNRSRKTKLFGLGDKFYGDQLTYKGTLVRRIGKSELSLEKLKKGLPFKKCIDKLEPTLYFFYNIINYLIEKLT